MAEAAGFGGPAPPSIERAEVVIVGGGFGAISAAMALDRALRRGLRADVTLVSRANFFLFTPLLAEVAASLVEARHVVNPIRRMCDRVRFIEGTVRAVDPRARAVRFVDENGRGRVLEYAHCVLAVGGVTDFFGIPGLAENALTLKTLGDALRVRNRVIGLLERAALLTRDERRALLTFVVAGGGLNGTEVCGELHDFVLHAIADYPTIARDEVRMVLVEAKERIARELPAPLGEYAARNLASRGVEVWLGAGVTSFEGGRVRVADGRAIDTECLIWTAGVRPSPVATAIDAPRPDPRDPRLPVDEFLRVVGHDGLWAVGDCALVPEPGGGAFQPPTAQHAVRQGRLVARNVAAALAGRAPAPLRYRGIGMLATLGRHRGVGRIFGVRLTGFPAWFAWRTYYLFALPRWDRRLRVAFDWALDLIFPPDIVEMKVEAREVGITAITERRD